MGEAGKEGGRSRGEGSGKAREGEIATEEEMGDRRQEERDSSPPCGEPPDFL